MNSVDFWRSRLDLTGRQGRVFTDRINDKSLTKEIDMNYKTISLAILSAALILINPAAIFAAQYGSPSSDTSMHRNNAMQGATEDQGMTTNQAASMNDARQKAENKVEAASLVLNEIQSNREHSIPPSVLHDAAAVAIIPGMFKAGLIAGGRHGTGVLLTQNDGEWSAPAFVSISGGSLGAQIGVQTTDLVLVFNNRDIVRRIVDEGNWTIGAGASVAAGTAGANVGTSSNKADVLAYKRTKGLFAGAVVSGATLSLDQEPMQAYYHFEKNTSASGYYPSKQQMAESTLNMKPNQPKMAVRGIPESAKGLQRELKKYASQNR
jgi:lipid-binding SYLF domain-containing protein